MNNPKPAINRDGHRLQTRPPTVIDGFIQPHFPFARVFTCFFFTDCLVFSKTGSGGTNTAGSMRSALGGYGTDAMITGGIGTIVDIVTSEKRGNKAAGLAAFSPEDMVAAHKRNFMLSYGAIQGVEMKGPNIAGELKVIITADKVHTFRIDRQSKESASYIKRVFNEFVHGDQAA